MEKPIVITLGDPAGIGPEIIAKAFRDAGTLRVKAFWPEVGVKLTKARRGKLESELEWLATFSGCERVEFLDGWERETISRPSI